MSLVNRVVFVLALSATLLFWIGGILLIGEIRYTLLDPQIIGWGGVYLNLFKYIALPASISVAAFSMTGLDDIIKSILGYIAAILVGFILTIPFTIVWLFLMAILGVIGFMIAFVTTYW